MPRYHRCRILGGTYFFTVNLADRKSRLLVDYFDFLRLSVQKTKAKHPFHMNAWVVLPDHMHCIWTMPTDDDDFSARWWMLKSTFSRNYHKKVDNPGKSVWQNRFWEHAIRNQEDFNNHMDYIHINPLKHGHVDKVYQWPYSSFHYLVTKGVYSREWTCNVDDLDRVQPGE